MIRAVLFDVGGPLDLEVAHEAAIDADLRAGLAREGIVISEAAWRDANEFAVASFAPSVYKALIWRLTSGDAAVSARIYEWVEERGHGRDIFELRPGIAGVLEALRQRGFKLGLVANQPAAVLARLERHGIAHYFANHGISGVYGYRKPDVRLFLRACEDLGVEPTECVMVGDRIDNDVVPAKLLDMRTVLLRTGRHIAQQPRSWDETPDAEVHDAAGILTAIEALIRQPSGQQEREV
jgi:HAD superfamily hydrolase (TIGR01549 family)